MRVLFRNGAAALVVGLLFLHITSAETFAASGSSSDLESCSKSDFVDPAPHTDAGGEGPPVDGTEDGDGDPIDIEAIIDSIRDLIDLLGW